MHVHANSSSLQQNNMKKKGKKHGLAIVVCLGLVIFAGYFYWIKPKYNQAAANKASTNNATPAATPVTTVTVKKQKVQPFTDLPGRVNSYKIAQVRPQIDGIIKAVKFDQGSFVKAGQPLYQIDSEIYLSAVKGAESNVKSLTAKRNRYKTLLAQDAVSKQEFADVQAALDQAESAATTARKNLKYTQVLAPISGYIGKSNYTEGALANANQTDPLTTITQLDPIYVDLQQPSKDVIAAGHHKKIPVTLITEDPNYHNTGILEFSEKFADESTDSVRLRAIFSNKDEKLLPGMFINARIHLKPYEAITVPQRVTNRMPDGTLSVWVVQENNTAKMRIIKAKKIFNDSWIVEEGLEEGDVVIYEGFQKINDGAKVKPTPLATEEPKLEESKSDKSKEKKAEEKKAEEVKSEEKK